MREIATHQRYRFCGNPARSLSSLLFSSGWTHHVRVRHRGMPSCFLSTVSQSVTALARHPDGYLFYVWRCVLPGPTILAGFAPAPAGGDGIGAPLARQRDAYSRRLVGVYLGLPATAAVADMPVGTPSPFASALEQAPDRTRTARQQRPGSVSKSRSRPVLIPPSRRVRPRQES
jgi:hypothetical protein